MDVAKPSAVIFDVGKVLYGWDPDSFLVRQIADDEARLRYIEDVDLWAWHDTLDGGRPFGEAAAELSQKFPDYAHLISAWGDRFGETISDPVPGSRDRRGAGRAQRAAVRDHQLLRRFLAPFRAREGRLLSAAFATSWFRARRSCSSPTRPSIIWRLSASASGPLTRCSSTTASSTWRGARAVGMHAHLFTDAEELRARLRRGLL
jgi:2-haloacid dehalogenase